MNRFTKKITTQNGEVNFIFSKVYTPEGQQYHVDVWNFIRLHAFFMAVRNGAWEIIDGGSLPRWQLRLQGALAAYIDEQENNL
jgi:hypothetical protein